MPEHKKATLKEMLGAEVDTALAHRPDLTVLKIADGARDNWTFLSDQLPAGPELVDFFYAAEHLHKALAVAYGTNHPRCKSQFQKLRVILRDDERGVERVIRSLTHLRDRFPRRKKLQAELSYFRRNRHRMRYLQVWNQFLPIGSGLVEAACKTLVTQRLKRSGMRWHDKGGQAILTFRSAAQSDRFDRAWSLVAGTDKNTVQTPPNVWSIRR